MYYYNSYYFESGDIALNICFNKIDQLQEEGLKVALMIKEREVSGMAYQI